MSLIVRNSKPKAFRVFFYLFIPELNPNRINWWMFPPEIENPKGVEFFFELTRHIKANPTKHVKYKSFKPTSVQKKGLTFA